ncbi:hypothetical protein PLICRDRAFT_104545 [Plicaturopsis crispa FD-325 SS-3]|nr:hypothetical protein PLICRDRAFT_104545 [Plicaturopsis crispa FD-325 SS-3]
MRRPTALAVDTTATTKPEYELTQSPSTIAPDVKQPVSPAASVHTAPAGPTPSIRLLFSLVSRRHLLLLVLPAIITSMIAGGIAPFMTYVIGQNFDAFAAFPLSNPSQQDKDALLQGVGLAALELLGLGVGALALSSITSSLWIWTGERNVMALRKRVYAAVTNKDMVWFDTKMGAEGTVSADGAGGLMAKFARETDDVRMASSLASGMLLQYLTTCITCLALAFQRSWSLTLVILSAVPALVLIQGLSQGVAGPLLAVERAETASAATLVDRAVAAIATVKAFNAAPHERTVLAATLERVRGAARKLNGVWGLTSAMAQFVMMGMFVQGFWFGAKLVREGHVSAGDVMSVFWACLIATSNLQMCIPQFIVLAKGKFAIAELLALVDAPAPGQLHRRPTYLRKIAPAKCEGEFALHDVTFAYPSRPGMPVLSNVSLFLPARETTFIVGGSGSGKSTIAQLLLRMYDAQSGVIQLDDQDVHYLDERWTRQHVAGVAQSCILFDMSVHDNVAMGLAGPGSGRRPEDATREEVIEACRAALMHDFIRDLPDGYDTKLGNGGQLLSGGQKQRLAMARARLRNPTVLVLDEATSALDATSRVLVFEAIKRWRQNKTTIVITHDLSQIGADDFVYVLKGGEVVEQGYRSDLEVAETGDFRAMMEVQGATGGFVPAEGEKVQDVEALLEEMEMEMEEDFDRRPFSVKHQSIAGAALRPITMGNWMFDVVHDLTKPPGLPAPDASRDSKRVSHFVPADAFAKDLQDRPRRRSSIDVPSFPPPPASHNVPSRRRSLQFSPTSPVYSTKHPSLASSTTIFAQDNSSYDSEKAALQRSGTQASSKRLGSRRAPRTRWDDVKLPPLTTVKVVKAQSEDAPSAASDGQQQSFMQLVRDVYPTVPYKPYVLLGLVVCLLSGAMTPIFSFLLSRLLFEVSIGAKDSTVINQYGGLVLGIAALDGLLIGLKYFIMETAAMTWLTRIRNTCFRLILAQDKKWFDRSANSPVRLVQVLIKDGDDARTLIATVLGQCVVVCAMLGVGLIWALIRGWQLTLVGFAIAPIFAGTMALQTSLAAKCELRNKRAREDVAKGYYEAISNIRGIRSMAFESIFQRQFDNATDEALHTGIKGALVEGCTYGVASALIYFAEALLFYVGAVLIARGTYTYLQMVEVLNLVVFTVTIGSQLMAFTQKIAKSVQATRDFNQLLRLSTTTDESRGVLRPPIAGDVSIDRVTFAYPERPEVQVLKNISMKFADGECVAVVGASGSGKSTIAALLQRLYEPDSGSLSIGPSQLHTTDATYLREHVAVVSQNPNLFDATVADNIAYGNERISPTDVRRAAKAANVHEFIMSLPQGYDTMVGENASLISGGQAQRLQIARALARPSRVLILDECTSALDPSNEAAVLETIRRAKIGRTTVMVTHKLAAMRMCDRIVVVHEGAVAEEGTYEDLMARNGVFAQLASGGEWAGE